MSRSSVRAAPSQRQRRPQPSLACARLAAQWHSTWLGEGLRGLGRCGFPLGNLELGNVTCTACGYSAHWSVCLQASRIFLPWPGVVDEPVHTLNVGKQRHRGSLPTCPERLLKDIFNLQVRHGKAENLYSIFCWVIGSARRTKLHRWSTRQSVQIIPRLFGNLQLLGHIAWFSMVLWSTTCWSFSSDLITSITYVSMAWLDP